jgi:hypothetical protein
MTDNIKTLQAYALDNYEAGGHWVYETHNAADYQEILDDAGGNVGAAKKAIREYWELIDEVAADIRGS